MKCNITKKKRYNHKKHSEIKQKMKLYFEDKKMKKYVLVVYSYSNKEYRRVIGESTENHNKLCKAMKGLDMRMSDDYFSIIEEVIDAK